jgi:HSP20 family protein
VLQNQKGLSQIEMRGMHMTMTSQPPQTVPVQLHQTEDQLVLATPMPGLEPEDISIRISHDQLTIHGAYRGSRHDRPEVLVAEWTIGPYHRELTLPQPVNGGLTNATYGNGVLVLSMPKLAPGAQQDTTEFQLATIDNTRGQRLGHTGSDMHATTGQERRQHRAQTDGS